MVLKTDNRKATRHVCEEMLMIHFKTDPAIMQSFLPSPFELTHPGEGLFCLVDGHFNDEAIAARSPFVYPHVNYMRQVTLCVPCSFEGTLGNYMGCCWQDRDWCFIRGPVLGYPTELAEVHVTRFPGSMYPFYQPGIGKKVKGVMRQDGVELVSAWMEITGTTDTPPWEEYLSVFGRRQVEDLLNPSVPLIDDVLYEFHDDEQQGTLFTGTPHLKLGGAMQDWPIELLGGYFVGVSFSTAGSIIVRDLKKERKEAGV